MVLLLDITGMLISNVGFLGSAIVAGFVLLKGWREHLQAEIDKLKIREDARVAIAKEQSVGAEAIRKLQECDNDFRRRIDHLEKDLETRFDMAAKERFHINESLERLKKEHTDFINKSLEYFMGRKT